MKKIFTLLSTVLLSIAVFAAAPKPKTMLTVQSLTRGEMKVVIDGHRFEPNNNFMRLQGLRPGYHTITIYREVSGGYFNLRGRRFEKVFSRSITVRPRTSLVISIDRFGRSSIRESRFDSWNNGRNRGYDDRNYDRNRDYHDRDLDRRDNGAWGDDFKQGQDFDFDTDGRKGDYNWNDDGYGEERFENTMNDREFSRVMESIEKEWLESNKMKSASQIVSNNFLTSAQVRQMLQLFSFENNKVDLAKQAYGKTVDQRNFMATISDVFSFSSSKDELARYIRNSR